MREQTKLEKKRLCKKYPKKYSMWMCLARNKTSSGRCKVKGLQPSGRCRKHGGLHSGRPIKHGRYSQYLKGRFKKLYQQFVEDPNLPQLYDEVAIMRVTLVELMGDVRTEYGDVKKGTIALIAKVIDGIGGTLKRISDIKMNFMTMDAMVVVLQMIANILSSHLRTCPKCGANLKDIRFKIYDSMEQLRVPDMDKQSNRKLLPSA